MAFTVQSLIAEMKKRQEEARLANETRYQDILKGYENRTAAMSGRGDIDRKRINRQYDSAAGAGQQMLAARGLYNSTIAPSIQQGYDRDRNEALGALDERLQGEQSNLEGDRLGFMERRADAYPDNANYMDLLDKLGQGLYGGLGEGSGGGNRRKYSNLQASGSAYNAMPGGGGGSSNPVQGGMGGRIKSYGDQFANTARQPGGLPPTTAAQAYGRRPGGWGSGGGNTTTNVQLPAGGYVAGAQWLNGYQVPRQPVAGYGGGQRQMPQQPQMQQWQQQMQQATQQWQQSQQSQRRGYQGSPLYGLQRGNYWKDRRLRRNPAGQTPNINVYAQRQ